MCFQCCDPVTHPVLIFIKFGKSLKIYVFFGKSLSGYVAVRAVHNFQKCTSAPVPLCHFQIGDHIFTDPVAEQIGQFLFHGKRNPIFHQCGNQAFCLLIGPEKKGGIFNIFPFFHPVFQYSRICHILISWIFKFLYLYRFS